MQLFFSDAGRDWGQEEKGTTEDEMAGWYHQLDGRESEPRRTAGRRESGSQRPWLGEAAPQPEGNSVCAQQASGVHLDSRPLTQ